MAPSSFHHLLLAFDFKPSNETGNETQGTEEDTTDQHVAM